MRSCSHHLKCFLGNSARFSLSVTAVELIECGVNDSNFGPKRGFISGHRRRGNIDLGIGPGRVDKSKKATYLLLPSAPNLFEGKHLSRCIYKSTLDQRTSSREKEIHSSKLLPNVCQSAMSQLARLQHRAVVLRERKGKKEKLCSKNRIRTYVAAVGVNTTHSKAGMVQQMVQCSRSRVE